MILVWGHGGANKVCLKKPDRNLMINSPVIFHYFQGFVRVNACVRDRYQ